MHRYKVYNESDIREIMGDIRRTNTRTDSKHVKRLVYLSAAAIFMAAVNIFSNKGKLTIDYDNDVYKYVAINDAKYQVDTLVNKLESGEVSTDSLNAIAYETVLKAMSAYGGEEASEEYNKKHAKILGKHMFNKCNKATLAKLSKLDRDCYWFNSALLMDPMGMHMSEYGKNLLKAMESRIDVAKKLPGETYATGGYGHYGPDVKEGMQIPASVADAWFESDIKRFEDAIKDICYQWFDSGTFAGLTQDMFDALIMYIYNRGTGPLVDYSMLTKDINSLKTSDYDKCAEMLKFDLGENQNGKNYYSTIDGAKADAHNGWKKRRALEGELFMGNKYNPCLIVKIPQELKKSGFFDQYPKIDSVTLLQHLQQREHRSSLSSDSVLPES